MIKKIDHLGIAVRSIDEARKFYEEVLGLVCEKIETVESEKVKTAFFPMGESPIELLEPTDDDSPIVKFLEKRGEGLHHVAYATSDIENQLSKAKQYGYKLIHETPVHGAKGKKIAFLHPRSTSGVLIELCSKK